MKRRSAIDAIMAGDGVSGGSAVEIPLAFIDDNPFQSRTDYGDLAELARDIEAQGLLQPPVGRKVGRRYELAFGHRRLRACRALGWKRMPVIVKSLDDEAMATTAWAENFHREDVTPIDRALAIRQMMDTFGWKQREVAERLSVSRSVVGNALRLLKLPKEMQWEVRTGAVSERQAVAIVPAVALPEDERAEIFEAARAGESSDALREKVQRVRGSEGQGVRGSEVQRGGGSEGRRGGEAERVSVALTDEQIDELFPRREAYEYWLAVGFVNFVGVEGATLEVLTYYDDDAKAMCQKVSRVLGRECVERRDVDG